MKALTSTRNILFFLLTSALLNLPANVHASDVSQQFDQTLKHSGITFHVICANESSLNDVTITPAGLTKDNTAITIKEADGMVTGAEAADINQDGSPEIYVFVTSAGSGSYGSLIAYSANNNKSLTEIFLPPLEDDKVNSKGYMGHDSFSVKDNLLLRSFPIYKESDTNAAPTGGTRTLGYELTQGEAAWQLKLMKSSQQ